MTFPDIFDIDAAGGVEIAGAIFGLWAIAWVFRVLVRMVRDSDDDGHVS